MLLVGTALMVAACSSSKTTTTQPPPTTTTPPDDHPALTPVVSKRTGRLNLLQLRRSFPIVLGNDAAGRAITWNSGTASSPKVGFDAYASTLGEADFVNRTEDDLDASPVYVKFMDDAARSACSQAIAADKAQSDPAQRTLMRFVSESDTPQTNSEGFRKNLTYLKLRFHGIKVTEGAPLEALEKLFVDASAKSKTPGVDGWRAVCVALLTAPEFHLY
jgi:hypothetical protein